MNQQSNQTLDRLRKVHNPNKPYFFQESFSGEKGHFPGKQGSFSKHPRFQNVNSERETTSTKKFEL